jgi:hypothetical protein
MDRDFIRKIIKEELSKKDVSDAIAADNKKFLKSKDLESRVKEISAKVLEDLYKVLWQRRSFWSDEVKR